MSGLLERTPEEAPAAPPQPEPEPEEPMPVEPPAAPPEPSPAEPSPAEPPPSETPPGEPSPPAAPTFRQGPQLRPRALKGPAPATTAQGA